MGHHQQYYLPVKTFFLENPDIKAVPRALGLAEYDKDARQQVAANLARFRKNQGLSQSGLAKLLNVSLSQYKKYESGCESIRLDVAHRMSLKCGVPIFHLLFNTKYADYLALPKAFANFDRIWFFANLLTDEYFEKLCRVLLCFAEGMDELEIPASGITPEDFQLALSENSDDIYLATSVGIKAAREHFDFSQEYVAEVMEVALSTYQEYEKAANRPKYNLFIAARYCICLGINPFHVLINTHYRRIRLMQNQRIEVIQKIVDNIGDERTGLLFPLVEGFYDSIKDFPNSLYYRL